MNTPRLSPSTPAASKEVARDGSLLSRIRNLAGSTRGRLLAAVAAGTAAVAAADNAKAGLVVPGEIVPAAEAGDIGDDVGGLIWESARARVESFPDGTEETFNWVAFSSGDQTQFGVVLSLAGHDPAIENVYGTSDDPANPILSNEAILEVTVEPGESAQSVMGIIDGDEFPTLERLWDSSVMYVGVGELDGEPATIAEAIAMTRGHVYVASVPENLQSQSLYVLQQASVPEPGSGAMGAAIAAGFAAASGRRRRSE